MPFLTGGACCSGSGLAPVVYQDGPAREIILIVVLFIILPLRANIILIFVGTMETLRELK